MIWFAVCGDRNRSLSLGGVTANHRKNCPSSPNSIVCQSIRMREQ